MAEMMSIQGTRWNGRTIRTKDKKKLKQILDAQQKRELRKKLEEEDDDLQRMMTAQQQDKQRDREKTNSSLNIDQ